MPFRDRVNEPLIAAILLEALLDLRVGSARALEIALVHDSSVARRTMAKRYSVRKKNVTPAGFEPASQP